jgi:hypothetical protein
MREAEKLAERLLIAEVTVFGLLRPRRYATPSIPTGSSRELGRVSGTLTAKEVTRR